MNNLRLKGKTHFVPTSHSDFEFVSPGQERIFMVGFGCKSGIVFDEFEKYEHYSQFKNLHHFIKCDDDTAHRIKKIEEKLRERIDFRSTARLLTCRRGDIVETYMDVYPERLIDRL